MVKRNSYDFSQVVRMAENGENYRDISKKLDISLGTVRKVIYASSLGFESLYELYKSYTKSSGHLTLLDYHNDIARKNGFLDKFDYNNYLKKYKPKGLSPREYFNIRDKDNFDDFENLCLEAEATRLLMEDGFISKMQKSNPQYKFEKSIEIRSNNYLDSLPENKRDCVYENLDEFKEYTKQLHLVNRQVVDLWLEHAKSFNEIANLFGVERQNIYEKILRIVNNFNENLSTINRNQHKMKPLSELV